MFQGNFHTLNASYVVRQVICPVSVQTIHVVCTLMAAAVGSVGQSNTCAETAQCSRNNKVRNYPVSIGSLLIYFFISQQVFGNQA